MAVDKAKDKAAADKGGDKKEGKGGNVLQVVVIILLLLLIGGGGAGGWFLYKSITKGITVHTVVEPKEAKAGVFDKIDTFTVNLNGGSVLQIEVQVRLSDEKMKERIKVMMPALRDRIIRVLSSKVSDELSTNAGKQKLAEELKTELNLALETKDTGVGILEVLFSNFIIQ